VLVYQEGENGDLEGPVHAIFDFEKGKLRVSVNRWAVNDVDDKETSTGWARNRAAHLDNFWDAQRVDQLVHPLRIIKSETLLAGGG
jgi:hypothetical protein